MATLLPAAAEARTYGWRSCEADKAERIIGYFKAAPCHAEALERKSGHKAVFCSRIRADTRRKALEPVEWIPRDKGETSLAYFGRALARSVEASCPLANRIGNGSSLGL